MNLPAAEILGAIAAYIKHLRSKAMFGDYRPMSLSEPNYGPREQLVIDVIRRRVSGLASLEKAFEEGTDNREELVEEIHQRLERYVQF